jgi:Dna[CI] antecedent, DciA
MATEPIAKLLGASAELQPLAQRLAYIKRLQRRYRTLAPGQLAEASRVCAIDGTTVVICAASGPVAAILRQLAPRLLEGLREAARKSPKPSVDQELNSIRVEVQVNQVTPRRPVKPRGELPVDQLETVARGLSESPLRETLERISRRKK